MAKGKKRPVPNVEEENLDRFAGSSDEDEEEEEEEMAPPAPLALDSHHDADEENSTDDEDNEEPGSPQETRTSSNKSIDDDDDDSSSVEEEETDPATKMANVMSRILGSKDSNKRAPHTSSVVLGKTVTPLQKLQQKEKEQQKAMKEKRKANRERNLTALHLPLSIATTNTIESGKLSVTQELEEERLHRRVATRGVVALFNAITQHQRSSTENDSSASKHKTESSKMTKHGFLDKIKAAAKSKETDEPNPSETSQGGKKAMDTEGKNRSSWGALKDDYMLNSKKNWDEESSDEESDGEDPGIGEEVESKELSGTGSRKKRRVDGTQ